MATYTVEKSGQLWNYVPGSTGKELATHWNIQHPMEAASNKLNHIDMDMHHTPGDKKREPSETKLSIKKTFKGTKPFCATDNNSYTCNEWSTLLSG
jgi:hypothetical protein